MKIGKYNLHVIETGTFGLDGGAMFGIVPKMLWERTNPSDEENRVTLSGRCLLLVSAKRKILIDTGIGTGWDNKFNKIYRIDQTENTLEKSLDRLDIKPGDITDVLLTHLHFDHAGGSIKFENGKPIPAFPNAKYFIQQEQFNWAMNPSDRDRASFVKERFEPLKIEGVLELLDGEQQIDDEIEVILCNGHTPSQQIFKISDSSRTLLYAGDFLAFSAHVPLPYIMSYDLQPLKTIEEKMKILPKAVDEEWLLYFEHDPYTVTAIITKTDKGFAIKERFTSL
ncbi:MAG: MBL fold metallo-hydrolase [Ignavibacteria bacterium RBG_13_36_8]|nr:MAG: MBL fold metallo-hydrolase [Ignavibacteria bacterium RBG_13_36_8]